MRSVCSQCDTTGGSPIRTDGPWEGGNETIGGGTGGLNAISLPPEEQTRGGEVAKGEGSKEGSIEEGLRWTKGTVRVCETDGVFLLSTSVRSKVGQHK